MIRRTLSIALLLGVASAASAQAAAPPASQPAPAGVALPAGHPAIQPDAGASSLPPGHPQIDGAPGGGGNLPAGHPALPGAPKTVAHGSISLHASQGTAGGTKVTGDPVTIDVYSAGPTPAHFEGKLDATGDFEVPDFTIAGACQPLIKVTHAGVDYQGIGHVMDAGHAGEMVEVKVFDTTEQPPQWSMKMRHLIIRRSRAGLDVTEMIMLDNPADRVWRGTADAKGQHVTLDLPLPAGAQNVQLGDGLKGGSAAVKDGRLVDTAPLIPGPTQIQFTYTLPVQDGKSEIAITAPVAVGHMMMFVPDDGSTVTGDGLISAGAGNAAGGAMRFFMIASMPAGKVLKVDFKGLAGPTTKAAADDNGAAPGAPAVPEPAHARSSLPTIVGAGSAVLLVGGTIAIFTLPAGNKRA